VPCAGNDLETLRARVQGWLTPAGLAAFLPAPETVVERIARDWLALGGKRWRPLLTLAVYAELSPGVPLDNVRPAAVAVESLHKASLIHDDIEDGDLTRNGAPTLHVQHGVAVAVNTGDYLIGEGYRLLTHVPSGPATQSRLLRVVAEGHQAMCRGQGQELAFTARPGPLPLEHYIRLCERKTGAAFEVALLIGAILSGAGEDLCATLRRYSRALGVAYQIRDDLADALSPGGGDLQANRPSVLLALAWESDDSRIRRACLSLGQQERKTHPGHAVAHELVEALRDGGAFARAYQLAEHQLHAAERALDDMHHPGLKRLLRRLATRLLASPPASPSVSQRQE
jgi:geranylgeranyl pyrophosphate synthase